MMEYNLQKKEIIINRNLNELDNLAIEFTKILKKYVDYVIISGYISILLGRARATEDIDIFIKKCSKKEFKKLYEELDKNGFWCLNGESIKEIFSYLEEGLAVRFARKNEAVPNFEIKFPKRKIDEETFNDFLTAITPSGKLKISSLERQIAFKRYYLESQKDIEDALHIEELFKDKLDYTNINKLKEDIKIIKKEEENEIS